MEAGCSDLYDVIYCCPKSCFYEGGVLLRGGDYITPNLPTSIVPTNIARLELSGKSPMGLEIPPLRIDIVLESNPPKSTMLVGRLGVIQTPLAIRASRWQGEDNAAIVPALIFRAPLFGAPQCKFICPYSALFI